jgi:hypothetical protein
LEHIAERASFLPVIVIGANYLASRLRGLLNGTGIKVWTLKNPSDVDEFKKIQETVDKGVVMLHEDLSYGTDLRFKEQPECMILAKTPPSIYDFM